MFTVECSQRLEVLCYNKFIFAISMVCIYTPKGYYECCMIITKHTCSSSILLFSASRFRFSSILALKTSNQISKMITLDQKDVIHAVIKICFSFENFETCLFFSFLCSKL